MPSTEQNLSNPTYIISVAFDVYKITPRSERHKSTMKEERREESSRSSVVADGSVTETVFPSYVGHEATTGTWDEK